MPTREAYEDSIGTPLESSGTVADRPYVDWAAIFAGAAIAAAVSLILITFGAAVGLTAGSPFKGEGIGLSTAAILTALWVVVVQAASFGVGGYFAGRLRRGVGDGSSQETTVRDSAHGLIAWAAGILFAALLAAFAAAGVASKGADVAAMTLGGVAVGIGGAAGSASGDGARQDNWADYTADRLFRTDSARTVDVGPARAEVARIVGRSGTDGVVEAEDKAYITRQVAGNTGLSQPEAEQRVDRVLADVEATARQAEEKARQVADAGRKASIVLGFLSAAALLIGAAAASAAARAGGVHRAQGTAYRYLFRT